MAFIKMCNDGGMPASVQIEGSTARVTGNGCPFGLENTHSKVCKAMMEMGLEMHVEKTIAAGEPECKITYRRPQ